MRRIRSRNTRPELLIRKILRTPGHTGYRIHRKDLPGNPDIAFIGKRKAILVNGCFWHSHDCKEGIRKPKSNQEYWIKKLEKNRQRDKLILTELKQLGWSALTIWECELKDEKTLRNKLDTFIRQTENGTVSERNIQEEKGDAFIFDDRCAH